MKASTGLFVLLLASQVLPWASQPAHAQTVRPMTPQREDELDASRLQTDYNIASIYVDSKIPAFSADEVTEKKQAFADGNQIKSRQSRMFYRDQDGRERIEYRSLNGQERIFIGDPNAKVGYLIRPNRKDILRVQGEPSRHHLLLDYARRPISAPTWSKQVITSLGVKNIAGLTAAGMLTEVYFPPGASGNEKAMVETKEVWKSNQFPWELYSRSVTPREGETIVRMDNLKFGDQPVSLFAIPTDYPIRDIVLGPAHAAPTEGQ